MDLKLEGHRVIVTAGASGIGLKIAEAFVREGARVWICDLASLDHPTIRSGICDVSNRNQVGDFFEMAAQDLGGLDCLVNNAGIAGPTALIEDVDPTEWDQTLNICLTGQFNFARLAMPHLRQSQNPSMVNISSMAGRVGFAQRTPYAAAKWGVIGLTKSLSLEAGSDGVRVNAILPGLVAGDRQKRVLSAKAEAKGITFDQMESQAFSYTSIKDYVEPEQIADQVVFLASKRGRTISGQAISICGDTGMLA